MTISCPVCQNSEINQLFTRQGIRKNDPKYSIYQCQECRLQFAEPRPDMTFLKDYYDSDKKQCTIESYVKHYRDLSIKLTFGGGVEAKKLLQPLAKWKPAPATLLDVACGNGWHLNAAQKLGYNVHGMDISAAPIAVCKSIQGIDADKLSIGLFENIDIQKNGVGKFDIVLISQALEQAINPSRWIAKAIDLLSPSGILIIAVPNHGSLEAKFRKDKFSLLCPPEHLNYFTPKTFRYIAQKNSLTLKKLTSRNHYDFGSAYRSKTYRAFAFFANWCINLCLPGLSGRYVYAYFQKKERNNLTT